MLFRYVYAYSKYIRHRSRALWKNFFNAYLPNKKAILNGRVKWGQKVKFHQKTFFTGCGLVEIGHNCSFGYKPGGFYYKGSIEFQARSENSKIVIGNNVSTNNNIFVCSCGYIEINDFTLIGQYVTIMDFEAHGIHPQNRRKIGEVGEVYIGENVWIGNNVIILKNTKIGKNSVVAAGSVVSGVFPDNVVIGGVPARIIKNISDH